MEIIILTAWSIWTTRNDYIFKGIPPSLYRCRKKLRDELSLLLHKATRKSYALVENRASVGAFCRGRACTRDKWPGHVAPKPCGARRGFCRGLLSRAVLRPATKGVGATWPPLLSRVVIRPATKCPRPIYRSSQPPPPPHFFLGGEGGGVC
jgi:hypothetical protein